jgi:hypothetical protein
MYGWLDAFVWTLALEQLVYVLMLRGRFKTWWAPCVLSLALNCATHPLFWALAGGDDPVLTSIPAAEAFIAAVEALGVWLAVRDVRLAVVASAAANAFSWLAGPLVLARLH